MTIVGGIEGNPQQVCFSNSLRETQTCSTPFNRFSPRPTRKRFKSKKQRL